MSRPSERNHLIIARALEALARTLREGEEYVTTAEGLLETLSGMATQEERDHPSWPQSPQSLSSRVRRLAPRYAEMGLAVKYGMTGRANDRQRTMTLSVPSVVPPADEADEVGSLCPQVSPVASVDATSDEAIEERWRSGQGARAIAGGLGRPLAAIQRQVRQLEAMTLSEGRSALIAAVPEAVQALVSTLAIKLTPDSDLLDWLKLQQKLAGDILSRAGLGTTSTVRVGPTDNDDIDSQIAAELEALATALRDQGIPLVEAKALPEGSVLPNGDDDETL